MKTYWAIEEDGELIMDIRWKVPILFLDEQSAQSLTIEGCQKVVKVRIERVEE